MIWKHGCFNQGNEWKCAGARSSECVRRSRMKRGALSLRIWGASECGVCAAPLALMTSSSSPTRPAPSTDARKSPTNRRGDAIRHPIAFDSLYTQKFYPCSSAAHPFVCCQSHAARFKERKKTNCCSATPPCRQTTPSPLRSPPDSPRPSPAPAPPQTRARPPHLCSSPPSADPAGRASGTSPWPLTGGRPVSRPAWVVGVGCWGGDGDGWVGWGRGVGRCRGVRGWFRAAWDWRCDEHGGGVL